MAKRVLHEALHLTSPRVHDMFEVAESVRVAIGQGE
jgi:hypothetical protein